jgi:hypothetical protein
MSYVITVYDRFGIPKTTATPVETFTTDTTLSRANYIALVDATAADVDMALPAASDSIELVLIVKRINASGGAVAIVPDGSDTIDGYS